MTTDSKQATDIAVSDAVPANQMQATASMNPMAIIQQVASQPGLDVGTMEKLMDLSERWEKRQAVHAFNAALASFQGGCPRIAKTRSGNHNIKYAPLDEIMNTIQPHLSANGLSVRFSTTMDTPGLIRAVCTVSHIDGHSESSEITIPVDDKMAANSSQKMGSANSYAKRYALGNALNLAFLEDDTDAENLYETLTDDQAANIEALLEEVGADRKGFLKWARANSIEEIAANKYSRCVKELEKRRGNT